MKVDGLGVVLAIILLPIILVVTYYIQLQVDTIATENSYNTMLLNATYDAMSAFEINTANEELSSVADSMRSIVLASNNIFLNTLATNFGISNASKEHLQPYIPAVLYTMYDGYYIYSPTEKAKVAEKTEEDSNTGLITTKGYLSIGDDGTDGLGGFYGDVVYERPDGSYTINKEEAKKDTDYVLKSYVQYSARYAYPNETSPSIDVTINYTLDNYLNIVGKVKDVYYTKTGYLIKENLVTSAKINGSDINFDNDNETDVTNRILGVKTNADTTTTDAAGTASVVIDGKEINANWDNIKNALDAMGYYQDASITGTGFANIRTISEAETYLARAYEENKDIAQIQNLEYEIANYKAVTYYISSACFSNWVYDNLSDLQYRHIVDTAVTGYYGLDENGNPKYASTSGVNDLYYDFSNNATPIFKDTTHPDPEDTESNFNTHKMEVIKNSIKYNLNLAMSAYSKMEHPYECSLPVLLDEEWDKILSNISIVSFMQGLDCGLDIYNNYQIVSSSNNELTVTPSEIYYVKKEEFNRGSDSYHRIDCPDLADAEYISFKSKEVKYDKIYDKATGKNKHDHKNLACYTCINTNNYNSLFKQPNDSYYESNSRKYTSYYDRISSLSDAKRLAGLVGIAKERQNTYKTNALPVSEGYKIILDSNRKVEIENNDYKDIWSAANVSNVKAIQITFASTTSKNASGSREPVLKLKARFNSNNGYVRDIHLNLDQKKEQTVSIDISDIDTINKIELSKEAPNYKVEYTVKNIKAIYK